AAIDVSLRVLSPWREVGDQFLTAASRERGGDEDLESISDKALLRKYREAITAIPKTTEDDPEGRRRAWTTCSATTTRCHAGTRRAPHPVIRRALSRRATCRYDRRIEA